MKLASKIFVFMLLFTIPGSIMAQYGGDGNRLMLNTAMERTEEVLKRARQVVSESDSDRARNLLEIAIGLQRRAHNYNTTTATNSDLMAAGKLTLSARDKAQEAIAVARQNDRNNKFVRNKLEETEQMLNRAHETFGSDSPQNILALLNTAEDRQARAQELYRNGRLKMALKLSQQARRTLDKIFEEAHQGGQPGQGFEALQNRYYQIKDKIELAGFGEGERVSEKLAQAEKLREQAEELNAQNHSVRAQNMMQNALRIVSEVSEEIKDPARLENAYQNMQHQMDRLGNAVRESNNEQARNMYSAAQEHMEKARTNYEAGNMEAAAVQLQAALQNMSQIRRILNL